MLLHLRFGEHYKLKRYAQGAIFTHYVVHVIRDTLAEFKRNGDRDAVERATQDIINIVATCFTLITGKQCRCTLIDLKRRSDVLVVAARSTGSEMLKRPDTREVNRIRYNTAFTNLFHATNGCPRYYLCNDIPDSWFLGDYKSISFDRPGVGHPKRKSCRPFRRIPLLKRIQLFSHVANWNLPYRSTLILPIRHITEFLPPEQPSGTTSAPAETTSAPDKKAPWYFYGFLCIDCKSTDVFDDFYAPELGGTYADSLFTLFTQANDIANDW